MTREFAFVNLELEYQGLYHTTWRQTQEILNKNKQTPWSPVRKRTIPTERPPIIGEI
jgi:hypothetical protein